MRTIRLCSLTLTGWRGEQARTTTFSPTETTISGANGLGKSRHFDAFLWLLFGKDRQGRKDESIKTFDASGKTQDKAPCEVAATLEIDGKPLTLRRAFIEDWVKPRGAAEEVFRGHHTDCFWDDVPVTVTEYSRRIAALIDETSFKLLTSPTFFADLPWRDQRTLLFELAQAPSLEEIAKGSDEWASLLEHLGGKSLADYRRALAARKKKLREQLATVQPKIDQLNILLPPWQDLPPLERELQEIAQREEEITQALSSHAEAQRQQDERAASVESEIANLRRIQRSALESAKIKAEEAHYQAGADRRALQRSITEGKEELRRLDLKTQALIDERDALDQEVVVIGAQLADVRSRWIKLHDEPVHEDTVCPSCGAALSEEQRALSRDFFQRVKETDLLGLSTEGEGLKLVLSERQTRSAEIAEKISQLNAMHRMIEDEERRLRLKLAQLPAPQDVLVPAPKDLPDWQEAEEKIRRLSAQLQSYQDTVTTDSSKAYQAELKKITQRRIDIQLLLSDQKKRAEYIDMQDKLSLKGRQLSQQIADAEREDYQAAQLCLRQVQLSEEAINKLFHGVTFQLYEFAQDDRDKLYPLETCIPLVDGVPLHVANTARQITAGLEIIRRLATARGISAPVFIDNRECLQHLPPELPAQIINLRVSDDTELTITHH